MERESLKYYRVIEQQIAVTNTSYILKTVA